MKVNKKSNRLGKTTDDIITSDEYKLDLFPLPLLSVDILDSKLSANIFSAEQFQHEKSHMIQIMSFDNSIW